MSFLSKLNRTVEILQEVNNVANNKAQEAKRRYDSDVSMYERINSTRYSRMEDDQLRHEIENIKQQSSSAERRGKTNAMKAELRRRNGSND